MLRLENASLSVGAFQLSVDTQIAAGERVALLGASGSGKSTLLALIAGFLWPDAGQVQMRGSDVSRSPVPDRPVSILFQDGNLFPHLNVADNVGLGLRPDLRLSGAERDLVEDCLDQTGLGGMGQRMPHELSGGQQSRVALARMFLRDKPIALLDEPFSALDPGLRVEMLALLSALCQARELTLIMATHDLRDAERLCTRIWFMDQGRIAQDCAVEGLRDAPPDQLRPWL